MTHHNTVINYINAAILNVIHTSFSFLHFILYNLYVSFDISFLWSNFQKRLIKFNELSKFYY